MSASSLEVHPPIHSKGLRKNKDIHDQSRPLIPKARASQITYRDTGSRKPRSVLCENSLGHSRGDSLPLRPLADRIQSTIPAKQSATQKSIVSDISQTFSGKENKAPRSKASLTSLRVEIAYEPSGDSSLRVSQPVQLSRSPMIRSPNQQKSCGPLTITFSDSLLSKPTHSILPSSAQPPSPSSVKRRCELSTTAYDFAPARSPASAPYRTHRVHTDDTNLRRAQGHKIRTRTHGKSPTGHIEPRTITAQDFECHRREIHATISSFGSRIGALENAVAAALPIVAEARLLWMESTVVKAPTKLGTTRQALCEYYGSPKYLRYTGRVRARAYYLGLALNDLEYLQERLRLLGDQRSTQDTVLISPFGGGNERGDKTMVEAYRRDSKHGIYARRIWRVCYERVYSVDENWSLPVPIPDNSSLVDKIKGWLGST